jgi:hypothetical protein
VLKFKMCVLLPFNNFQSVRLWDLWSLSYGWNIFLSYWLVKKKKAKYGSLMIWNLTAHKYFCRSSSQMPKDFALCCKRIKAEHPAQQLLCQGQEGRGCCGASGPVPITRMRPRTKPHSLWNSGLNQSKNQEGTQNFFLMPSTVAQAYNPSYSG